MKRKLRSGTSSRQQEASRHNVLGRFRRGAIALAVASALPALAYADTWSATPADSNWNNSANWTSGTVPVGDTAVAEFGVTTTPSIVISSGNSATVGSMLFNGNSSSYMFQVQSTGTLELLGAGIQPTTAAPVFQIDGGTLWFGSLGAGAPATSAGNSSIGVQGGGAVQFQGTATLADASLNLTSNSSALFHDSSTAGNGTITSSGQLRFLGDSNAGGANISIAAGSTSFEGNASAASSTLTNSSVLSFIENSTAGDAQITTASGGTTSFSGTSNAGTTDLLVSSGGTLSFLDSATAANATITSEGSSTLNFTGTGQVQVGSLSGMGSHLLGGTTNLVIGGANADMTIGGTISQISSGAQLTKVGTGTLTLSGVNSYNGGTNLNGGIVRVNANNNLGTASGALRFDGGTLQLGTSTFSTGRAVTLNSGGGTIDTNGVTALFANAITGTGSLTKSGAGTLMLTSNLNSFTGGTVINSGTLQVGSTTGATGVLTGDVTNNASLVFNRTGSSTYGGAISGTGTVTKNLAGTVIFTGTNTYTGDTTVTAGTLQIGNGGTTGSVAGNIVNSATVAFNRSDDVTYGGVISGTGAVNKQGSGTLTYTGANTYTGNTTVAAGTLQIGNGGTTGSIDGNVVNNAAVAFNRSDDSAYNGVISGTGTVTKLGTGTLTLANENTYSGGTTISAGTLQIGNGGTTGSITGNIDNNSALAFNRSDSSTFGGVISGTGSVTKLGSGTLTYTGDNTYTGNTTISAGTLQIGDGGTIGSIAGNVANNGALVFNRSDSTTFGGGISGTGAVTKLGSGTLTYTGDNTYTGGTTITAGTLQIGDGGTSGSVTGDVANSGALVFNRSDSSTFSGVISGAGSVTKLGAGTLSYTGANTYTGPTTISEGTLQIGNGGTTGAINGGVTNNGALAFNRSDTFDFSGDIVGSGSVAQNGSGLLTLTGTNTYTGGTNINAGTLRVLDDSNLGASTGGLTFGGGTLEVTGNTTISRDVTLASSGTIDTSSFTTTLASAVSGSGSLTKAGSGTLTLTGANTYSGNTTISAGTLQVGNGGTTGNVNGNVANSGALVFNRSDDVTYGGSISGTGSVTKQGAGTLTYTGDNTYSGNTTISAGTLRIGDGGTSGSVTGNIANDGALVFDRSDSSTFSGVISGAGSVTKLGAGTLSYTGANTYTGPTTISEGTLQIGNGGTTGAINGGVTNNGALAFNRSDTFDFSGDIVGSGSVAQNGSGLLTLTGTNTYTGGTNINAGTLRVLDDSNLGASTGGLTFGGGTLEVTGNTTISRNVTLASSGTLDTSSFNTTLASVVSGSGSLTKAGTGTLTLTGANTYTGDTAISAGTLQVGNGGTTGNVNGNVANSGALVFNRSDDVTYGGSISGTGSVTKQGAGTLTYTGDNTYAGNTTISAGTLQIGDGGTTGTIAGDVTNNAAMVFNRAGDSTFGGVISGTGSVTKLGSGTLAYTGTNTYTGPTTITAGTLQIGNGGTTGAIAGGVTNNGTLAFNRSDTFNFSGDIAGTGAVTQAGSGLLTLTGNNTYTGGTNLNAGTLRVLADSNLGAASGGLTFGGGTLEVDGDTTINRSVTLASSGTIDTRGFNTTLASVVSGTGSLTKAGNGALILTGANTYSGGTTISGGSLQIGNGGTTGTIGGAITNNGVLSFNRSDNFNFGGNISGNGSVTHAGSGVLTLTGGNTYTGGTTINGGTLKVLADSNLGDASGGVTFGGGTLQFTGGTTLSRAVALNSGGGTIDTNGFNVSLAGVASGSGALTKAGLGTLTVTGNNTYSGGTTISGGTLQVGNGGTTGSISGNVVNSGTLAFNRSDNTTYADVVSGAGAVTKTGGGTLTLTGVNTYSGQTNVNGGSLVLSGGGRIDNTSRVEIAQSTGNTGVMQITGANSSLTVGGDVVVGKTGTGTLTVENGGALTAQNILLGSGSGSTGILNIGSGTASGAINANTVINGESTTSAVNFNHNDSSYTMAASIRNTLTVNFNGTGTTTLTGLVNNYSGGTNLNAGTLRIANNGVLGASTSALNFNGGTLQATQSITAFSRPVTVGANGGTVDTAGHQVNMISGSITGAGHLTKTGTGTLTLSPNVTASHTGGTTVAAGTLVGTTSNIQGNIVNNGAISLVQTAPGTYSGSMSGTGNLTIGGGGDLTISGNNTFTGGTTVSAGKLTLTGSLGDVLVEDRFEGTGTVNGLLDVWGTVTPGHPVSAPFGTLTVNGDVVFEPGSTYEVRTDASGVNASINVVGPSGTASIFGGVVSVMAGSGNYNQQTDYTLISAAGGVVGAFDAVFTDFAFLDAELNYDANNVLLRLTRNDMLFSALAETPNQQSSATYLESMNGDSSVASLVRRILNLNAADARTAFASLAGDGLAEFGRISQAQSMRFTETLTSRLGGGIPGGGSFGIARDLDRQTMPEGDARFFQAHSLNRGMWMRSFGLKGGMDSDGNGVGTDWQGGGTALGFDVPLSSSTVVGTSFLYGRNTVELDEGRGGAARIKSPQAAVYGSYSSAGDARTGWQLRGLVGYAQPTISSERIVTLGNSTSVASSRHDGREISATGEAEVSRNMGFFRLHGMFGLRASRLAEEGFTETGSLADLEIAPRTTTSLTSSVGARVLLPTYRNQGLFDLRAVFSRELGSLESNLSGRLASSTSDARFNVSSVPLERNAFTFGAGFSGRLKRNLSYYADYSLQMRGAGQTQHTGLAGLRLVW